MPSKSFWGRNKPPILNISSIKKAAAWFKKKARDITKVTGKHNAQSKVRMGRFYTYRYKAKHDKILPQWDRQPIVVVLEMYKDGFLGLNFHYLPIRQRYMLLSLLMKTATGDMTSENDRLKINYPILKAVARHKLYAPCVKRYLYSQVQTKFSLIHPQDYQLMISLPTARWVRGKPY